MSPVDESEATVVTIDVFVRDKHGHPVADLTREQFRVFQDDTEMAISTFSVFTEASFERPSSPPALIETTQATDQDGTMMVDQPPPIFIVLYVDNQNLRQSERNRILGPLQAFAEDVLTDPVQILVVAHEQSIEILQPFTDDPRAVIRALRGLRLAPTGRDERDEEHARVQREIRRTLKNRYKSRAGRSQELSATYNSIRAWADEENDVVWRSLNAIQETLTTLTGINGSKYFVYISSGLPMVVGRDLFHEFATDDQRTTGPSISMPYNSRRLYDSLASAANAQEITVHTVDASGLDRAPALFGEAVTARSRTAVGIGRENQQLSLRLLAEKTGGLAVVNTDDFGAGFDRIKADLLTYYTIGYGIEKGGDDTVHHIDVMLDQNPGHELRFRQAYVEKSIRSRVQDRVTASLILDFDDNPMALEVSTAVQTQITEDRWVQPLTVSVPVRSVALSTDGEDYVGRVVVFVASRDLDGRRTEVKRQEHELRLPADEYERRKGGYFDLEARLLLDSGRHHLAVGVLDETTRRASYKKVMTVSPDPN